MDRRKMLTQAVMAIVGSNPSSNFKKIKII